LAPMAASTMIGVKATASAAPVVHMAASAMVGVGALASAGELSRSVQSIGAVLDLLLQAVIVPGDKTAEGTLVEAVAIPWFDIIELLKDDPAIAFQIPPHRWEEIIAGAYQKAGFEEVTLTPRSGDYGRDVIAIKRGLGSIRVIDQVKAYGPGHLVTADDVRALVGVVHGDGASKGFLTTTSDFAPLLRKDPLVVPFIPSRLELIDGKTLLVRLEELARKTKA
jgi:restriction system protein